MDIRKAALRRVGFALIALLLSGTALGDEWVDFAPAEPFRPYTPRDGLSQADANFMTQDTYGYLWITTRRGLSQYDGREFRTYTIAQGLPANHLTYVLPARDEVWIGDARGNISRLHGGKIDVFVRATAEWRSPITGIVIVERELYFATESRGLFRINLAEQEPIVERLLASDAPIGGLAVSGDYLWFLADRQLMRQALAGAWNPETVLGGVRASHFSAQGEHWIADDQNRLGVVENGDFKTRHRIDSNEPVVNLTTGYDGEVWAHGAATLFGFATRELADGRVRVTEQQIDQFSGIQSLFVDHENTLWVGADSRLARYLGDRFEHYALDSAGFDAAVWSISGDRRGTVYFGTQSELVRFRGGRAQRLNGLSGIPRGPVRDIVAAGRGRYFIGVRGHGVYVFNSNDLTSRRLPETAGLEVLDLGLDTDNRLWIGSRGDGLSYVDLASGARTRISAEDEPNVYTFDIDPDGVVWYGADGIGLVRVEPANSMRRTVFDTSAGFALTSFDHVQWINPKEIWVGTEDGGLYLFDGLRATNIGPETPLRDQTIYLVEKAPDGTLIVGGEEGLYQIDPTTLRSYHYSALSGFVGLESNVHATFMDEGGQLWIGTIAGAAKMDFHRPMPPSIELNPQIVSVATQQTREMVRSGEEVSWNQKGVSTEYVAISLLHPGTIEYSYRLQGLDGSWGPPTRNRRVDYSSLGAGKYVFEVRARFPNQEWGDASATYHFTMLAPYWRQPWFVALALALAVLAVPLLIKLRMRQVEGVNRRLRRDVLERTRSIERAKAHLEATNRRLSKEADERRKSDMARVEVEARFMRAFQSSPIGMALITPEGLLADTNPALQRMLWPDEAQLTDVRRIVDCVAEDERDVFRRLMDKLESGEKDSAEADLRLVSAAGSEVATVVTLSAIRDDRGEYKYSVCQVQDVTEARRMTDQLEYQANYDELTGLLNRRAFEAALARAYREAGNHRTHSFLMFMDLDQFKIVNDTSGHAAGDELLRLVSQLIRDQVRADDVVGRLGGDEFALLLWQCPEHVALRIAESIRSAVEDFQFNWDTETYRIGVSIGAVPLDTSLGDISELQQLADAACFEAKDAGRNRVHVVRTVDDAIKGHRGEAQWVQRLRDAMEHDRFALYGQLIKPVNPNVNEPERMEILLRMRDPATRKLIPPGAFLPAAERYGLSTKLDQWVVENLIRTLFVHEAFGAGNRRYWINLSGNSVGDRRFAEFLVDAIQNSPLPTGMLNFEITETAVIRSVADAGKLMAKLRDLGCQFALDDFGSGLSSFGYLKKLPVDYLKIDGMFVRDIMTDPTDRIFVRSIIDIAHTMGIKVTTEFVENEEMLEAVASFGADYVQGYGIHRPEVLFPQFPVRSAQAAHMPPPPAQAV